MYSFDELVINVGEASWVDNLPTVKGEKGVEHFDLISDGHTFWEGVRINN